MPLERTLEQVERDVARGDLGAARQRLHSLIDRYPYELRLRDRLAEVYAALQYPERAGCFGYLSEQQSPEQQAARRAFEAACGGRAVEMLRRIRFCGDLTGIAGTRAAEELSRLQRDAHEREGMLVTFAEQARPQVTWAPSRNLFSIGCAAIPLILLAYLVVAGLLQTLTWFSR